MEHKELEVKVKEILKSCNLNELDRRSGISKSHLSKFVKSKTSLGFAKTLKALYIAGYELEIVKRDTDLLSSNPSAIKVYTYDEYQFYYDMSLKKWVVKTQGVESLDFYETKDEMFEFYPDFELLS